MNPVEAYIFEQPSPKKEMLDYLHHLILGADDLQPKLSYRIPFYYRKSWVCYLNATNKTGVEFALCRANELASDFDILSFGKRAQVASVEFHTLEEIPEQELLECLQAAIELDERKKYSVRKG